MAVEFRDTQWRSYDLRADTLAAAASAVSGMHEAATTEWFPRYDFTTSGAIVSNVTVTVAVLVTMPRWIGFATASQAEQLEWVRFCRALRAHEQGHVDLVREHLKTVDEQMRWRSPDDAKRAWEAALAALADASRAYDEATDHGRHDGTVIDVAVGDFTEV